MGRIDLGCGECNRQQKQQSDENSMNHFRSFAFGKKRGETANDIRLEKKQVGERLGRPLAAMKENQQKVRR